MKRLDEVELNKAFKVVDIQTQNLALRKRILDMGVTPDVEIKVIKTAPLGDPIEVKLRGYSLSFRKQDASSILVEEV